MAKFPHIKIVSNSEFPIMKGACIFLDGIDISHAVREVSVNMNFREATEITIKLIATAEIEAAGVVIESEK